MASLAFSNGGERFDPPESAAWWRVKKFGKTGRGGGDVVYTAEGQPLFVPIDADLAMLRAAVGDSAVGRFKLDPVDEEYRSIEGTVSGYAEFGGGSDGRPLDMKDEMLRYLVRSNREIVESNRKLTETIANKFADVMDSAATLIRAADGAGIASRQPPAVEVLDTAPELQPRNDGGGVVEGSELANTIKLVADKFSPMVGHMINTKVLGLSDEQSLALVNAALPSNAPGSPAVAPAPTPTPTPTPEPSGAGLMMRLQAIEALLGPDERRISQAAFLSMSSEQRDEWKERVMLIEPHEAVAEIRQIIKQVDAS